MADVELEPALGGDEGLEANNDATDATCLLEDNDMQCGHIFYNEESRLLKFYCTFCRETYDDINVFCAHLSDHINEEIDEDAGTEDEPEYNEPESVESESMKYVLEENSCEHYDDSLDEWRDNLEEDVDEGQLAEHSGNHGFVNLENNEMIVEELNDSAEIAAEVLQEMQHGIREGSVYEEENSNTSDFLGYDENEFIADENTSETVDSSHNEVGQEVSPDDVGCASAGEVEVEVDGVDESSELIQIALQKPFRRKVVDLDKLRKKKKRVTTVKVIAVKNRIAELYERIKHEEEKRSQPIVVIDDDEGSLADIADGNGSASASANVSILDNSADRINDSTDDKENETESPPMPILHRKIIGETLITLLPDSADTTTKPTTSSATTSPIGSTSFVHPPAAQRYHLNTTDKDRTCPACGKQFRSSFSLAIHKRSHYLESDSNIKLAHKCSDCDQLFNKIQELKEHVKKVHYPEGFICKICNKKLSRLSLLEMHMRKVHLARPFSCEICKKSFSNREEFDVHVNSHMVGQDYRCHICGRKYPTESVLQFHMKRHKEPIPQCCVVCGKMTLRITQHMKIHTPRPKRVLSCSVCGKVFNFSSGLSHHFKIMHKLPRSPQKPKKDNISPAPTKRKHKPTFEPETTEWTPQAMIEMDQKEEEAKRVIVELIQNAAYTPYFSDNNHYEAPPIAREETISAINSIVTEEHESDLDVNK